MTLLHTFMSAYTDRTRPLTRLEHGRQGKFGQSQSSSKQDIAMGALGRNGGLWAHINTFKHITTHIYIYTYIYMYLYLSCHTCTTKCMCIYIYTHLITYCNRSQTCMHNIIHVYKYIQMTFIDLYDRYMSHHSTLEWARTAGDTTFSLPPLASSAPGFIVHLQPSQNRTCTNHARHITHRMHKSNPHH